MFVRMKCDKMKSNKKIQEPPILGLYALPIDGTSRVLPYWRGSTMLIFSVARSLQFRVVASNFDS